jgi:Mlc titration factor MtfA (ptsG expression regulator)
MNRQTWSEVFQRSYARFCQRVDAGEWTDIDPYAAESPAEFFAVMSEAFFEIPRVLQRDDAELYEQLAAFYRQRP